MSPITRSAAFVLFITCAQTFGVAAAANAADGGGDLVAGAGKGGMTLPPATRDVLAAYPGTRVHTDQGRISVIYGAPMTPGLTAEAAATAWLEAHSEAFGAGRLQLEQMYASPVKRGEFTAFGYRQYIDGLPVEYGNVRLLVRNDAVPRVVFASATVSAAPNLAEVTINLDGETARQIVNANPLFRGIDRWTEPELAIYQGDGEWIAPTIVWKFSGEDKDTVSGDGKTFFVDVATGRTIHVRSEIFHDQVSGMVQGWGTPGVLPDAANNPPALHFLPEMRVRIEGGPNTLTDLQGQYTIPNAGTLPLNIGAGVGSNQGYGGRWVNVVPSGATPVSQLIPATPPTTTANFVLNENPTQPLTAQVNVFIGTTLVHNYFKDRAPAFTALDIPIVANTGVSGTCNAFFSSTNLTINFYNAGGGCPNTGYSSVIAHEYGHFIVNRLNLGQGGFGEGYSDVTAMMLYDDGIVGRGFFGIGNDLRNPVGANVQYPCSGGGVHHCGQIIGAVWWRLREAFGATYGVELGLEAVRDLQVAWSLATNGGTGSSFNNSAHPTTAIEVLTVDDNDGFLGNGTPNWNLICQAFAAHSIDCPALSLIEIQLPQGAPERITPGQTFEVPVNVVPIGGTPLAGSGKLSYRTGAGAFTTVSMTETAPNQYVATLPAADCGQFVEYYFSAQATGGMTIVHPPLAPQEPFAARAVEGAVETIILDEDFESSTPWAVTNHASLTTGQWGIAIPAGTVYNNQQVQPGAAAGGQRCYITDNRIGASVSSYDVDGGPTTITTPAFDLTGAQIADLTFSGWLFSVNGMTDTLKVEVSNDDGLNWTPAYSTGNTAGWADIRINLFEYIAPTSTVRVRFVVSDNPNDSLTEAAIDNVRVTTWVCEAPCYANCDQSTIAPILNVDDFTCFINRFAAQDPWANCDGSTTPPVLNVDDFTCFINTFAQGCP